MNSELIEEEILDLLGNLDNINKIIQVSDLYYDKFGTVHIFFCRSKHKYLITIESNEFTYDLIVYKKENENNYIIIGSENDVFTDDLLDSIELLTKRK